MAGLVRKGCPQLDQAALGELDALDEPQHEILATKIPLDVARETIPCTMAMC
jgi:hypothetical protein